MDKESKHWKPAPVVVARPVEPEPAIVPATPPKDGAAMIIRKIVKWLTS